MSFVNKNKRGVLSQIKSKREEKVGPFFTRLYMHKTLNKRDGIFRVS